MNNRGSIVVLISASSLLPQPIHINELWTLFFVYSLFRKISSIFLLFFHPFYCPKSIFMIIVGRFVAPYLIVSPLRAVDKMHFIIAIDPLHSMLMRKWPDLHSCSVIRLKSMNHSIRSMILHPPPVPVWLVVKFIFNAAGIILFFAVGNWLKRRNRYHDTFFLEDVEYWSGCLWKNVTENLNKHTTSRNLDLGTLYNLRIEYLLKSSLKKDLPMKNVDEQIFSF